MTGLCLNHAVAILSEGSADQAFLRKLQQARKLPDFDLPLPLPQPRTAEEFAEYTQLKAVFGTLHSRDSFVNMLIALSEVIRSNPGPGTLGIIIVADAAEDPAETFKHVANQCRKAELGIPADRGVWSERLGVMPAVAILTVPHDDKGGLETLCVEALRSSNNAVAACVRQFLECAPPVVRSAEKAAKAELACFTAVLDDDPTKSLKTVFERSAPLIDVLHPAFDPLDATLRHLLTTLPSR